MSEIGKQRKADKRENKGKENKGYWYFIGHNLECLKGLDGNIIKFCRIFTKKKLFKLLDSWFGNQIFHF